MLVFKQAWQEVFELVTLLLFPQSSLDDMANNGAIVPTVLPLLVKICGEEVRERLQDVKPLRWPDNDRCHSIASVQSLYKVKALCSTPLVIDYQRIICTFQGSRWARYRHCIHSKQVCPFPVIDSEVLCLWHFIIRESFCAAGVELSDDLFDFVTDFELLRLEVSRCKGVG